MMRNLIFKSFAAALCLAAASCLGVYADAAEPENGLTADGNGAFAVKLEKDAFDPSSFTVAAWVKTPKPGDTQGVVVVDAPAKFFSFYLYNGFRMLVAKDDISGSYDHADAPNPQANVWTHYAGTYDGKTIRVYKDGKLAQEKAFASKLQAVDFSGETLWIGGVGPDGSRSFSGSLADVALWKRAFEPDEIAKLYADGAQSFTQDRAALWTAESVADSGKTLVSLDSDRSFDAKRLVFEPLLNKKDSGYRGVWYYNQRLDNEYVYKYSGGMGTYPANHYPFAVYRPEVDKTFFCYGGFDPSERTLWHEVGVYDHKTKKVSRPTVLLDKNTSDAHDNPVMSMDDEGRIWVFSTSHGTGRPSFIHRSVRPYDITEFELVDPTKIEDGAVVPMNNFSYFQVWNAPERGFIALFTTYNRKLVADVDPNSKAQRLLALATSKDGVEWSAWKPLAAIEIGHYQNARVHYSRDKKAADGKPLVKIGTAFNYHPAVAKGKRGVGLNWRTNLYYMESDDLGATWRTVDGKTLETPLLSSDSPAMIRNYEAEELNVYVTDLAYDAQDRPMIAYVTSKGFESGPEMGPREFCVAHWLGDKWEYSKLCVVDNNYEYAMFYTEEADKGVIRLVGAFEDGPQAYNTGGEISQWISRDNGSTWTREYQLTENSEVNQSFPRRTIDANPDFYAFWATGNGREKSISTLRFSTKDGQVFELPREMKEDWESPIPVRSAE